MAVPPAAIATPTAAPRRYHAPSPMLGYIAVTDPGWYAQLRRTPGPKDANFWRPSARAFRLEAGTPFFFKLKAPANAVAGFGYFAGFTILPDWLAWDTFGEANGVGDLRELRGRLSGIQKRARIQADAGGRIGCCLVAESVFFAQDDWVAAPRDWKPRTQTGSRYDLSKGEGERVWRECLARAAGAPFNNRRLLGPIGMSPAEFEWTYYESQQSPAMVVGLM